MIYACKPAKIAIYVTKGKTAAQVKAETGADAVINGGIFALGSLAPLAQLRVDGKTLANENWGVNYGYGFDADKLVMAPSTNINAFRNFIACVCLIRDGQPVEKLAYPADMGGARQRTAIGLLRDGSVWMMADKAVPRTPEQLRAYALEQGCVSAIMLDGGASTQCAFPGGTLTGGRTAANYICVWEKKEEDKPVDKKIKVYLSPSSQPANIYAAGNTNEQVSCRRIAAHCQNALERCGFEVKVGEAAPDYKGRTAESNAWGADYHIPIHTNAGGGHGALVMVYSNARKSLGQPVYDALNDLCPWKSTYGVRVSGDYEIIHSVAPCIYVEAAFHDNEQEAAWIVSHQQEIGEAICKGICKTAGVEYIWPKEENKEKTLAERIEALEAWARTKGYV